MDNIIDKDTKVKLKYISCAHNRLENCVDWGNNNLICFATNHSVAIYNANVLPYGKITQTLSHHKGRVNVVEWIKPSQGIYETEIISASTDGTAIIWTSNDKCETFEVSSILKVDEPLPVCSTVTKSDELIIFLGSTNGNAQIWKRSKEKQVSLTQSLNVNKKFIIRAKFCILANKIDVLLGVALEDSTIQIFAQENSGFESVLQLTGHKDWVSSLDFVVDFDSKQVYLASGSQDRFIRLWKISLENKEIETDDLQVKKQRFQCNGQNYEVKLESVLCAHSGWIYGLQWYNKDNCIKLLSSSLDNSMIIWEYNSNTQVWSESIIVGDVGGNGLGYYSCQFGPDGNDILTCGFFGAFYRWRYCSKINQWKPLPTPSGHFGEVVDLEWDKYGRYLITAGTDQTTRIHAPWIINNLNNWYEISRPQIHGYDMSCLAMLTPESFASGAEEKVARIFVAPLTFKKYLSSITNCNSQFNNDELVESESDLSLEVELFNNLSINDNTDAEDLVADSASVPALGLTNKAVFNKDDIKEESLSIGSSVMLDYSRPPLEEELIQHSLWPETEKLYGHGYELFTMAATSDGQFLATASKSTSHEYAAIILWDTKTWHPIQKLYFHQLTITQLEFSNDDKYLLAVSRDRVWSLYERKNSSYEFVKSMKKNCLHKRIIWCCSWTKDSKYFATGSRDGKIGIWNVNDIENYKSLEVKDNSITALSFAQADLFYILAVGFESGLIEIYVFNQDFSNWKKVMTFGRSFAHHLTVKRLKFRPMFMSTTVFHLASCSSDSTVKIYELDLTKILKDKSFLS